MRELYQRAGIFGEGVLCSAQLAPTEKQPEYEHYEKKPSNATSDLRATVIVTAASCKYHENDHKNHNCAHLCAKSRGGLSGQHGRVGRPACGSVWGSRLIVSVPGSDSSASSFGRRSLDPMPSRIRVDLYMAGGCLFGPCEFRREPYKEATLYPRERSSARASLYCCS